MKKTRTRIFETNSSSTHSLSFGNEANILPVSIDSVELGEFGWGFSSHNDARTKLSYALTYIQYCYDRKEIPNNGWIDRDNEEKSTKEILEWIEVTKHAKWLHEMVTEFTGNDFVICKTYSDYYPLGYIDHQSLGLLSRFWSNDELKFKEKMKNFIFDNNIELIIDNDNHW